ncbi:MAG: hypothetical protein Kow002_03010 [Anaerolineales bacterium]
MRKFLLALLGLILLAGQGFSVRAQGVSNVSLLLINTQGFPAVSALLDVYDAQGKFISGLSAADVTIIEDGIARPVDKLAESQIPAQIVVAVNPGPALATRDGQGKARWERVTDILSGWAQARQSESDDNMGLASVTGPLITNANLNNWVVSLVSYQPDFRSTTPNLQSLTVALDIVTAQTPQPGMKRAILFITPHMDDPNIDQTLNSVSEYALETGIRINIWLVDNEQFFDHPSTVAFRTLAQNTGGSFFAFSGLESFPDPESYFEPLRHLYTLQYASGIVTAGEHTIQVQVRTPDGAQIDSAMQSFDLDVQPPNPILIAPPAQIIRQAPPEDPFNADLLLPDQLPLEMIIEFPDGHPRPLARTTLYVDDQPVAQNDAEPFDQFTWDLSVYTESGIHQLRVEAVDTLGLSKVSANVPITVTVVQPPSGFQALLARYRGPITLGAVSLALLVLITILFYGRVRIRSLRERRAARKQFVDPVTQPIPIRQTEQPATKREQAKRLEWARTGRVPDAPAYLVRLKPNGEPMTGNPIPLTEKENSFGNDPVQAEIILDDPSISPLHARVQRTETDEFLLLDNSSIAGTWLNYEPVSREGSVLKHGDVVHFGQLTYRFALRTPPAETEPKVIYETSDE